MVELAVRTKLILDTVDAFILTMESPVNKRRRMVYPVIIQRQVARQRTWRGTWGSSGSSAAHPRRSTSPAPWSSRIASRMRAAMAMAMAMATRAMATDADLPRRLARLGAPRRPRSTRPTGCWI